MTNLVSIPTALCLPAPDIEALVQGRMVAVMPRTFINPGQQFVLHPCDVSTNLLPVEQYYRSNFLPIAQTTLAQLGSETVSIKVWARCELCQSIGDTDVLPALSRLTVWTTECLQEVLRQRHHIFLAYLRVYQLPQPIEVAVNLNSQEKIGKFVGLLNSLTVTQSLPVLSDRIFTQRRRQLENLEPPLHPELEELESAIAQLALSNPAAESLNHHIQKFLGWATNQPNTLPEDLAWIYTINDLGTATIGGNYEKGTAFEQIVHKSLAFLGFGVDPTAKGGAGGMDLYCTTPYPLVGECKAGKSIPDSTVEQLDRIGKRHLGKEDYDIAVKLIIGPGEPTKYLKESADVSIISIINPMTLQKLVELQAKYPGSVNLIELKTYLGAGQTDPRIDEYIEKVQNNIKLRSHIVQAVKQLGEPGSGHLTVEIRVQYNAVFAKDLSSKLDDFKVYNLLIELSSPLTGYLGRKEGTDWKSDRFYFLRNLQVE
ncbi:DUF1802 family protein [Microcoleus sp. FACHB-53]|nr:DUF1802 family protein [Microcoleus sp. FACHB-53]